MSAKIKRIDYHEKKFKNPYFNRNRTQSRKIKVRINWKNLVIIVGIFLFTYLIIWLFFISQIFTVKGVSITGIVNISEDKITNIAQEQFGRKRMFFLTQKNILFFDAKSLENSIKENYNFKAFSVTKKYFSRNIIINIQENTPEAIWQENNKNYLIDSAGNIVKEVEDLSSIGEATSSLPMVINLSGNNKVNGLKVEIGQDLVKISLNIWRAIGNKYQIKNLYIDNDVNSIKCQTVNNTKFYFTTNSDISYQINKLNYTIKEKLKNDISKINYIDVRYGENVYFK